MEEELFKELRLLDIEYRNKPSQNSAVYNNKRTLVIVVDMVHGFTDTGALKSPLIKKLVTPISAVLDYLNNSEKIFVCDKHEIGCTEFSTFPAHCVTENEYSIVPELKPFADKILYKNSVNAVFHLIQAIDPKKYDNYIIMGCCTDICVLQLSISLKAYLNELNLSSSVIVFTDYVQTFDAPAHNAVLSNILAFKLMETNGVKVYKKLT